MGDFNLEFNIQKNYFIDDINSSVNFDRIAPITDYDEILIYSHLDNKWWVIDYDVFKRKKDDKFSGYYSMWWINNAIKYSHSSTTSQNLAIYRDNGYFSLGTHDWMELEHDEWSDDKLFYTGVIHIDYLETPPEHIARFNAGISVFIRNSTNIQLNQVSYPTMIKKELDHLHINAPLSIYAGKSNLDDLGLSRDKDLKFDGNNGTDHTVTVDNAGGWYLVRQANQVDYTLYSNYFFIMIIFIFV